MKFESIIAVNSNKFDSVEHNTNFVNYYSLNQKTLSIHSEGLFRPEKMTVDVTVEIPAMIFVKNAETNDGLIEDKNFGMTLALPEMTYQDDLRLFGMNSGLI